MKVEKFIYINEHKSTIDTEGRRNNSAVNKMVLEEERLLAIESSACLINIKTSGADRKKKRNPFAGIL